MGASVVAFVAWMAPHVVADDETDETDIRIQAPLQAVDCAANTITVLGATVDIQAASISGGECDDDDDDEGEGDDDGEFGDLHDGDEGSCVLTCADLVV